MRYGDLMKSLDLELLLVMIKERDDPLVINFIQLCDSTLRTEIISDYTTWSDAENSAWEKEDWQLFSTLRGYSPQEIVEFANRLDLIQKLDLKYGEGYSCSIEFLVQKHSGYLDLE